MKKLLLLPILFIAFACSKPDNVTTTDPVTLKATYSGTTTVNNTAGTILFKVNSDGSVTSDSNAVVLGKTLGITGNVNIGYIDCALISTDGLKTIVGHLSGSINPVQVSGSLYYSKLNVSGSFTANKN